MGKAIKIGILIAGLLLLVFGLVRLFSNLPSSYETTKDWVKGEGEVKATLIEYSDLQCPACKAYYPVVKQLEMDLGEKVRFIYRHFPLRQHLNSKIAAYAAEAAGKQDRFWQMHDLLFENQEKWAEEKNPRDIFVEYARSLNLDIEKFKNDLDSKETRQKVEADLQSGLESGVNATPTFFLNGVKLQNPGSYEEFKNILNEEISKQ